LEQKLNAKPQLTVEALKAVVMNEWSDLDAVTMVSACYPFRYHLEAMKARD
jgi:hypothetical protein